MVIPPNGPAFGPFWLNVKWFGASGNGTPDGAAVQNAFNEAQPGQIVYFPLNSPAGYNIDTAVTCPAGVLYYTEAPFIGAGSISGGQQVFLSSNQLGNVMNYGATGNGGDDTAAVNRTIAALTVGGAPASGGRRLKAPLVFPPGYTFKITSDIDLQSFIYPQVSGYGATLEFSGDGFTKAGLLIDGAYQGVFSGLTLTGDGTEQLPAAIKLDNSTVGFETTTGNEFRDIKVAGLKYVTGLDWSGTGSRQLDGTQFDNVIVSGQQAPGAWSSSGNWQNGILLGNGTFGNNYDHNARGLQCSSHFVNYHVNVSSLSIDGAQPANGGTDFVITPGAQCSFRNIQSQSCGQFLTGSGFAPEPVTFEDVLVSSFYLNAGGILASVRGGMYRLQNFTMADLVISGGSSYLNPGIISVGNAGANKPATLSVENLCAYGAKTATIVPVSGAGQANISVSNYMNYDPLTGLYTTATGDILSGYTGTSWTNVI